MRTRAGLADELPPLEHVAVRKLGRKALREPHWAGVGRRVGGG